MDAADSTRIKSRKKTCNFGELGYVLIVFR